MRGLARLLLAAGVYAAAVTCTPAAAAPVSGGDGYIDSPDHGGTYNRPPGAPYALIDYKDSGMRVWISGAQANEQFFVSALFTISRNGVLLPPRGGHGLQWITCDGQGFWEEYANETGVLQQLQYGTPQGSHYCEIISSLTVQNPDTLSKTYDHRHTFTVN